ncbi:MAG: hypothetical protein LUI12_05040 [Clostridiales bacterium]|nr:hypothetical protein [Clostridiales bacterium]
MTREQIQDFLAMIQATYPNFNPPNKTAAVNAWKLALEEYEEDEVHVAFKLYMQTNASGFAPVPGQIIDKIHTMTTPQELNEMEAWSLVANAIRNSGYNSVEEFAKLPPTVQKAVGQPSQLREWALTGNFNQEVAMSGFQRAYRVEAARERERLRMPKETRILAENISQNSYKAQIEQENEEMIKTLTETKENEIKQLEERKMCVPLSGQRKDMLKELLKEE